MMRLRMDQKASSLLVLERHGLQEGKIREGAGVVDPLELVLRSAVPLSVVLGCVVLGAPVLLLGGLLGFAHQWLLWGCTTASGGGGSTYAHRRPPRL